MECLTCTEFNFQSRHCRRDKKNPQTRIEMDTIILNSGWQKICQKNVFKQAKIKEMREEMINKEF